jgi:hypothetical protein
VRRLSVASLNSGAQSPGYGAAPSVVAEVRVGPLAEPSCPGARQATPQPPVQAPAGAPPRMRVPQAAPGRPLTPRTARLAETYGMSVVAPHGGRWYVKDIRASTQPRGAQMTRYASSWAAPRGPRSPHQLTDVHGREG